MIEENPHKLFQRRGNDIHFELRISFPQAALGERIEIPTLDGRATLTIPAGIQTGTVLRLAKKGIKILGSKGIGDLLVKVTMVTPKKLSTEEKELLEKLKTLGDEKDPDQDGGLFGKMKDAFNR